MVVATGPPGVDVDEAVADAVGEEVASCVEIKLDG
jgi:hypothetical protein